MSKLLKGADLVLVSHGVRGPSAPASMRAHRERVEQLQALGRFNRIIWGHLNCEPYLKDVIVDLPSATVVVLPMLMSDGYFCETVIPDILRLDSVVRSTNSDQQVIQCSPLGLSAKMTDVMIAQVLAHCRQHEMAAIDTSLVVIGHGSSKSDASRLATSMHVVEMRARKIFNSVHDAYLEEAPDLPMMLQGLSGDVLVVGYFANHGLHASEDVPRLIEQSQSNAHYLGPVGVLAQISEVVMDCVDRATND
jgi:sirohydrochlorin cobaltochelatase